MLEHHPIYLATVCLERNRWGNRQPSFRVSDWLARFAADGFDGIELWENHYLAADAAEQACLEKNATPVAIYNSYAGFTDTPVAVEQRARAAAAIARLRATGVKYNLGNDPAARPEYRRNLLAWANQLPASCRLLCECHPGTVLEKVNDAVTFFADLDSARFGVIAHVRGDAADLQQWIEAFGPRLQHLHLQLREPEPDPITPTGRERLAGCCAILRAWGFRGSAAIEFTRGIGRDEQIEIIYANACVDQAQYRQYWT